ncbi:MAG: helix-turn-helix domain-containing protein [Gemmatimonadetes bacterium]|nr:helix-turn-helix domain-containing protein [Gemmatimonadota bacterium]
MLSFATALLIEDTHTDEEIAQALGVTRRTLARWKQRPDVALALETQELLRSREFFRERSMFWDDEELGPLP